METLMDELASAVRRHLQIAGARDIDPIPVESNTLDLVSISSTSWTEGNWSENPNLYGFICIYIYIYLLNLSYMS